MSDELVLSTVRLVEKNAQVYSSDWKPSQEYLEQLKMVKKWITDGDQLLSLVRKDALRDMDEMLSLETIDITPEELTQVLTYAVRKGSTEAVEMLLKHGALPNSETFSKAHFADERAMLEAAIASRIEGATSQGDIIE